MSVDSWVRLTRTGPLCALLCVLMVATADPLSGQTLGARESLQGELRVQLPADTTWYATKLVNTDGCFGLSLAGDPALALAGDMGMAALYVRSPEQVARLERRVRSSDPWSVVPIEVRRELGACFASRAQP